MNPSQSSFADRRERGRALAAAPGAVARDGGRFAVTIRAVGEGPELTFHVRRTPDGPRCTCPDFKRRGNTEFKCEHIYAVVYFISDRNTSANADNDRS